MKGHLTWSPAAISGAAFFGAAGPVGAKEHELYGDVIPYMLGWGFDTMGQCQAMSADAVAIASAILFSLALLTPTRRLPASVAGASKGSTPLELATAGTMS
jgi:uncharacterized membrane protein